MEPPQKPLVATIKDWFDYNPETGVLLRKKKTRSDAFDEVNYHNTIPFQGWNFPYAVLCWIVYYGVYPTKWIDHKDRIKSHNWITNLREATPQQNQQNKVGCGTFPKGVAWRDRKNPWLARIRVEDKRINLGSYPTMEQAAQAYIDACIKYHGEFACHD